MNYLENQAVVNDAANKPSEPLPVVKSEAERRALEAAQKLDLTPGAKPVDVHASALTSGSEAEIIRQFHQTYEVGLEERRRATAERDAKAAKATAIHEQHKIIGEANAAIVLAKREIAAAEDRIAIAQRKITELGG